MKIQRFNENLSTRPHGSIKNIEKFLIEKYNDDIEEYTVKFIDGDGDDVYAGGSDSNLDNAINFLLERRKMMRENCFFYIIKVTSKTEVIPNEELERMIDAKKYNL